MGTYFHPTGDPIEIPPEFAGRLADAFDLETPPETLWEWWLIEGRRMAANGWTPDAEDLYGEDPTRHELHLDGTVRYAACALDALAAAAMSGGGTVTVRSVDPVTADPVMIEFGDDGVTVAPGGAVISVGSAPASELPDIGQYDSMIECAVEMDDDVYAEKFCEYGNTFESRETYDRWVRETDTEAFPASAANVATLLYRLHRCSRIALASSMVANGVTALETKIADGVRSIVNGGAPGGR